MKPNLKLSIFSKIANFITPAKLSSEKVMKSQPFSSTKLMYSGLLAILVLLLAGLPVLAQDMQTEPDPVMASVPQQQGPTDPQELEAFLDGVFAALLEAHHIPGATVTVVKDGELFFAKGYGYADLEKRIPVEPDKTLFRIGSVSKLFTWTAVMQLAEQGKLNLNEDVNTYLTGFKIPDTYPEPITLAHLMTHTAGFEERSVGTMARTAEDLEPLGVFLATNMPARVRPPGEFTAYSNYGTQLAGYIVEEVSGRPFEDYVEENIFKPLDMQRSTFRQPLPSELAPDMAAGYTYENGVYRAEEFEYCKINISPSGAASATSTDMAKFMIAHLQNGRYGDKRILNESTAKEMHRQHFTHDPRINGMCYGFYEGNLNNQRIIMHYGDLFHFHSLLVLLPEKNLGLFLSFNGGGEARTELKQAFLNRYYPAPDAPEPQPPSDFQQRAKRFTGSYWATRSSYTTYEKIVGLVYGYDVSATDNCLLFGGKQYVEVEKLLFREVEGQQTLVFREDGQGRITHMFEGDFPYYAHVKLAWYEAPRFHNLMLRVCMVFFLSALVAWPVSALRNRLKGEKKAGVPRSCQARWVAGGMSALYVLFLVGIWVIGWMIGLAGPSKIYGVPPLLPYLLVLPLVAAVLTIAAIGFTVLAWKNRYWGVAGRVYYTLVTVAALAFIWWLNYWNLLGFRF
jgi:CubicO group peptidase (beta-lactamase class C family)